MGAFSMKSITFYRMVLYSLMTNSFSASGAVTDLPGGIQPYNTQTDITQGKVYTPVDVGYAKGGGYNTLSVATMNNSQAGVGLGSGNSADLVALDMLGQNGFVLSGHSVSNGSAENWLINKASATGGGITTILNYGDFLSLVTDGTYLTRWGTWGSGKLNGVGRALWNAAGATIDTVENTMNITSANVVITNNGTIGALNNNNGASINGVQIGIDNEDQGIVSTLTNNGVISGLVVGIRNYGTIGHIINMDTITGGGADARTLAILNEGTITDGILNYGVLNGDVVLGGATLTIAGNNAALLGDVTGDSGSRLIVGDSDHLATFTAAGLAHVEKISVGSGSTLTVSQPADWRASGNTADAVNINGALVMNDGSALTGNLLNNGIVTLAQPGHVFARLAGNTTNGGNIVLNPTAASAGNTLTINGDYAGVAGSSLSLGTVLGDDSSLTDKLVITGTMSGESVLNIINENGAGGQTLEGIQVVKVDGTSSGTFTQNGRLVAGVYDYALRKGNTSGTDANGWYLSSTAPSLQGSPTSPGAPGTPTAPHPPANLMSMIRPETASYISNQQAARTVFTFSVNDRARETPYTNVFTGKSDMTSTWIRNEGGHNKSSSSNGQNKTTADRYVLQLGGNVGEWSSASAGKTLLGVMGGYAIQHSHTRNTLTGNTSRGNVHGYSAGLYGEWYQHTEDSAGLYVGSWLQYAWFDNEVKGGGLPAESYKSQGLSASLETGYSWQIADWAHVGALDHSLWLRPHAQIVWSGIQADDRTEDNGTRVSDAGHDNVQTTLGMRVFLKAKSVKGQESEFEYQPFIEANWIYNTQDAGVRMNDAGVRLDGARNIGELKTGIEGKLNHSLSIWAEVAQQMGGKAYRDTQGALGIKYQF